VPGWWPEDRAKEGETDGGERERRHGNGPSGEAHVEGEGIRVVRPGFEKGRMPQGVLGIDAISHDTVGSEGIFMARYAVPPGAHSDLHSHANCETAVYVLRGRGYAYSGEDMDEYIEAGPEDFVYIPANLAHVVGCPEGAEQLEYIVVRNAPEEIVVTLRRADELQIGPDGTLLDA
jgi:uncharacterized RmlC-like cupin family protein